MRIALLSTLERDPQAGSPRAAFAGFAGAMVVERQLDLAIRLGCERIICLVDSIEREVLEVQDRAESAGKKFRALRNPARLSGMVTAEDEVLVLAPGLLPDDDATENAMQSRGILAFPADLAVPLGFERIDLELAWSGAMMIPGNLIERLAGLPADVDVPSALMRLALQSGTPMRNLDRELLQQGKWHLGADRQTLDAREKRWIDAQRRQIAFRAPGVAVAERAGARLARDILGQASEPLPLAAAYLSIMGALGLAAFGHAVFGLALVTLGALFGHMAEVVARVSNLNRMAKDRSLLNRVLDYLIDPVFILLLIVSAPETLGFMRAFVPLMLFGLLRLSHRHASEKWRATYGDRILLGCLLTAPAFLGYAHEAAAILALLVLVTRFFAPFRGD